MTVRSLSPTIPLQPMKGELADLVNSTKSEQQAVVWVIIANSAIFAQSKLGFTRRVVVCSSLLIE